ncbi:conserved hypothetical protein [Pediculus humanus corporis]|uniref:Uncharacterized protein n=1 Tax=Pediculus humanus subsp. corporis TaxID=121224 RepID=E0VMX7_PEDHC|nr:uncharacterized protein Phum_PHUM320340 [Pediculus humanus corporis]EEB14733.1 conserved hypothetical protein [Pediculus humanus corporis]
MIWDRIKAQMEGNKNNVASCEDKNPDKNNFECNVSCSKKSLLEMTNWSAMSKWLEAIGTDLKTISEKSEQEALSSRKLRHRMDADEKKMKLKIEILEEENKNLQNQLRENESKIFSTKNELEQLLKEKIEMKEEIILKNNQLTSYESEIIQLREQLTDMRENLEKTNMKIFEEKNALENMSSGNPIIDMESQIEANNLRIESLLAENETLKKTLTKIKTLKGEPV